MNKLKEKEQPKAKAKAPRKENAVVSSISSVVSGNFLTRDKTMQQLPFVLFLMVIAMAYISNTYYAEKTVREINKINNELKELRSEYITSMSDLMFISKQSEVAKAALPLGIVESVVPPKKIVVKSAIAKK